MGLDTRAYRRADHAWKQQWVEKTNKSGKRVVFFGLAEETLVEPVKLENAPLYHQDDLEGIGWPGGLIGGMISGFGDGPSFRGKAYSHYVEAVTGQSLYEAAEDHWEGANLAMVAEQLRAAVTDPAFDDSDVPPEQREALARWFEVCVKNDLVVGGDY